MPEISSDSSRMLVEKRSIACRSGASSSTISMKSPPRGAAPTTRIASASWHKSVSNASAMARCHGTLRMSISWCTTCGMSEAASRRRWRAHLHRHRAGADAAENLPRQSVRHHAARRCVEHQRRGVGGGEAIVEPVQAEVGDRRHVDQHFGDHHEQDRQHQELAGQAKPHRSRRGLPPGSGVAVAVSICSHRRPDRHPRRRSTFSRRPTHDDVNLGVKKDTAARLPISL